MLGSRVASSGKEKNVISDSVISFCEASIPTYSYSPVLDETKIHITIIIGFLVARITYCIAQKAIIVLDSAINVLY